MNILEYAWISLNILEYPWISLNFLELPWTSLNFFESNWVTLIYLDLTWFNLNSPELYSIIFTINSPEMLWITLELCTNFEFLASQEALHQNGFFLLELAILIMDWFIWRVKSSFYGNRTNFGSKVFLVSELRIWSVFLK